MAGLCSAVLLLCLVLSHWPLEISFSQISSYPSFDFTLSLGRVEEECVWEGPVYSYLPFDGLIGNL